MKYNNEGKHRVLTLITSMVVSSFIITSINLNCVQAYEITNQSYENAIEESIKEKVNELTQSKRAIENKKLKIAFVGDSITEGSDLTDLDDIYTNVLVEKIKNEFPDIEVEHKNFSLGARMMGNLLDDNYKASRMEYDYRVTFSRPWATEGKSWKECVKDFEPDLVILAFGMNDSFNSKNSEEMFYNNLKKFSSEIRGWMKTPDLALVSTILPTKNKVLYNQSQDITNALASVTRIFAKKNGYICADANRLFQILRDGKDVLSKEEKVYNDGKKVSSFLNGTIEFEFNFKKDSKEKELEVFYRKNELGSALLKIQGNSDDNCNLELYLSDNDTKFKDDDGKGKNKVTVSKDNSENHIVVITNSNDDELKPYKKVKVSNIKADTNHKVKIETNDIEHKIYIDENLVAEDQIYRKLTPGQVEVKVKDEKDVLIKELKVTSVEAKKGYPVYSEEMLLGRENSGDGNGINHPTKFSHRVVYGEAFNNLISKLK